MPSQKQLEPSSGLDPTDDAPPPSGPAPTVGSLRAEVPTIGSPRSEASPTMTIARKTLVGIPPATPSTTLLSPPVLPGALSRPSLASSHSRTSPPPVPSRASLPPVLGRSVSTAGVPPAPPSRGVTLQWDGGDDEATHIFDRPSSEEPSKVAARPAAGAPSPSRTSISPAAGTPVPSPAVSPAASSSYSSPAGVARPTGPSFPVPPASASLPPPFASAPLSFPYPVPSPPASTASLPLAALPLAASPPRRPTFISRYGTLIAGGAFGAVVFGSVLYFLTTRPGKAVINVSDAQGAAINRLEISVDGKVQCQTAPCTVESLSPGPHDVSILAPGFQPPAVERVSIEASKVSAIRFALVPTKQMTSGLRVAAAEPGQPGVRLFIDGAEVGPLPQSVHDIAPGTHTIRIAGSDRYAPSEQVVNIGKGELVDLGAQPLRIVKGKAAISLHTPGARVQLISGRERRELSALPITLDIDTSQPWSLEATKPGYVVYKQAIGFEDGVAEKSFAITLNPKGAAPRPAPRPAKVEADEANDVAEVAESGFLNINSIPASTVTLDGRPLGATPKLKVPVKAGVHTVQFVNTEDGLTKEISVTVGAGETKAATARLRD